jgi:hypothetical protein
MEVMDLVLEDIVDKEEEEEPAILLVQEEMVVMEVFREEGVGVAQAALLQVAQEEKVPQVL